MATQGPLSPGTIAENMDDGNASWIDVANAGASDNAYVSIAPELTTGNITWAKVILLIGGSEAGANKSDSSSLSGSDTYKTFGGAADKWTLTPTDAQINASGFGVRIQLDDAFTTWGTTTHLDCTNFGFTIPGGATIDGITVEIENKQTGGLPYIDHVRITVNYTGGGGGSFIARPNLRQIQAVNRASSY